MKNRYFFRLGLAVSLTLLMTWGTYKVIIRYDKKYFHSISKNEFVLLEDTTSYDMLLLGSSRMKNNVNPRIVDSITKLNTYNAGSSGANLVEINTILQSYLLRHAPPKYIVLALDLFSLESDKHLQYYPTYITCNGSPPIREALKEEGVPTALYQLLPFLKIVELNDYYKGVVVKAMKGETDIAADDFYYKGFVSNTANVITKDEFGPRMKFGITEKGLGAINEIIRVCEKNGTKLVLTYAPEYKRLNVRSAENADEVFAAYDSIARVNNIPFYHDEYLELNQRKELFANNGHLNRPGAEVYSVLFAQGLISKGVVISGK